MIGHRRLACSFCGKSDAEVAKLVAGPRVYFIGPRIYICDQCAALTVRIMDGSTGDSHATIES